MNLPERVDQDRRYSIPGVLAALISIGAGIYLLMSQSASVDTTVFDAIMHGMGGYFIARGLWMFATMPRPTD